MTGSVLAARYAGAIFALDKKAGEQAMTSHGAIFGALGEILAMSPALGMTLKSPAITPDEKKAVMGKILDKLDADRVMRNFCDLLADKGRLGDLGRIATAYRDLLDEEKGIYRGSVITAVPLTARKQAALAKKLRKKVDGEMALTFMVDPGILGGMVLTIGDRVLDSSLRAQLEGMRETFKRGV